MLIVVEANVRYDKSVIVGMIRLAFLNSPHGSPDKLNVGR